jgi:TetR/AcrR family acrAB operon transcriptional repressor
MVRRTKQEAQETRSHILDTAERVFLEKGVSRTSLEDVAVAAGVTRGAIYWHFRNKGDLFDALMQRISLPMEEMVEQCGPDAADPLEHVRSCALHVLRRVAGDRQVQRVQEICHYKVEYAGEMEPLRARHLDCRDQALDLVEAGMREAASQGLLSPAVDTRLAAIGLHSLVVGLIQNWLLDPGYLDLDSEAERVIDGYLDGLRAEVGRVSGSAACATGRGGR